MEKLATACTILIALTLEAAAETPAPRHTEGSESTINGVTLTGPGELHGEVYDENGKPFIAARVHVVAPTGEEQLVTSDRAGQFRVVLKAGGETVIFVRAKARISGYLATPTNTGADGEVIEMHETMPPAVLAKPKGDPSLIPPYSSAAIKNDAWVRAWLMLDVTERGVVSRVKLLTRPGNDLDAIAIREAWKLQFEPARDRAGRAVASLVVWSFEWPSYWWLTNLHHGIARLPSEVRPMSRHWAEPALSRLLVAEHGGRAYAAVAPQALTRRFPDIPSGMSSRFAIALVVVLLARGTASANVRVLPPELQPQIQADLGLAVVGVAYEQPLSPHFALQIEAQIFGTYFLPWFDAGDKVQGGGGELRPTWFPGLRGQGLYVAPYFRLDRVSGKHDGMTGTGFGMCAGAFVGYAFRLTRRLDLRVGAGLQYIYIDAGPVGASTPFIALDTVIGYRL